MKKMSNDEKIKNVKIRKILKVLIIIFALLTIGLSLLSLWKRITPLFALSCFIVEVALSKYRDRLDPKEKKIEKK